MDHKVSFTAFCRFMEQARKLPNVETKKNFIHDFSNDWRGKDANLFPFIRLVIPKMDRSRSIPLKEATLTDFFLTALGVSKSSPDALRLREWSENSAKEFPELLEEMLTQRCPVEAAQKPYCLADINSLLDSIQSGSSPDRLDIFRSIAIELPINQQIWIVRLILKEMKLGLPDTQVLKAIHPRAPEVYFTNPDLESLCKLIESGADLSAPPPLSLFKPARPMLAIRSTFNSLSEQLSACPADSVNDEWRVEAKVDGERIQLHTDGERFCYFGRNGGNYSRLYGFSSTTGPISNVLVNALGKSVENVVLDGEMILVNEGTGELIPMGTSKITAETKSPLIHPCYLIFDILYLNGKGMLIEPYSKRIATLKSILQECKYYIEFVPTWPIPPSADIKILLTEALSHGFEGLMFKKLSNIYQPALRTKEWIKLKPDYIDSLSLEIDAIVIGADPGRHKSTSTLNISTLICAVKEGEGKWCVVSRVGSGYTMDELSQLCKILEPSLLPYHSSNESNPYPWLCGPLSPNLRPTYIISDPYTAPVIQIRVHGLVKSEVYPHGQALRFPRFMKMRPDRSAVDCTTLQEIQSWKLPELSYNDFLMADEHEADKRAKRKKIARRPKAEISWTVSGQRGEEETVGGVGLFGGFEYYVCQGDVVNSKADLEKLIINNGGRVSQNPKTASIIISGSATGVRVGNLIKKGGFLVVKSAWILECVERSKLHLPTEDQIICGSIPDSLKDYVNECSSVAEEGDPKSDMETEIESDEEETDKESEKKSNGYNE